ncbi:MAG: haloacid dehalogenase-like hydrolase [Erysipelotrichaceae bacterium]|nr:haloacid dehalogenase-like hydrolase [Erysipelotrichaceae bacterium]
MSKKPILAILYDFDSTLSPTDMQAYGFIPRMGMTPSEFWARTGEFAKATGCEKILSYMYTMVAVAKEKGINMTREFLNDCGKDIDFYPGVLTWFKRINDYGAQHGLKVEHYLISSGNKEIVEGCAIAKEFKAIFGCEFIFDKKSGEVIWPKLAINYTQKTQFFFRISKGVFDTTDDDSVNQKSPERRIPYANIVYIGDGMTDVPSMLIVKNNGGRSIAVYPKGKGDRVVSLKDDGRVNYTAEADYSHGKKLEKIVQTIINSVEIREELDSFEGESPKDR